MTPRAPARRAPRPCPPRARAPLAAALSLALATGCAATGPSHKSTAFVTAAPPADTATFVLWHFDENGGPRVNDSSPGRNDGVAGPDTRTEFGRIAAARTFTRSIDSFVWSAYHPELESPNALTVETWIRLDNVGTYEDTPIVGRWTPLSGEQSWLFSVAGRNVFGPSVALPGPGDHASLVSGRDAASTTGHLMFAFQPREADEPHAYFSSSALVLGRWTHVAVTFDGRVVCFYVNNVLDSQYAVKGAIRPSPAPLLAGNAFDPRRLTIFGGDLHYDSVGDRNPYYALEAALDELRISNVARTDFPYAR